MAGFECEFVEKPPKAFQCECPICLLVLREPYQATCCGKSFCRQCADLAKARNQVCPTCNSKNFNVFHNLGLEQPLYDFQVYCTHKSQGCKWTGELRELDNHLDSDPPADRSFEGCPYMLIKCPLNCAGCVEGVLRKNCKDHIRDNFDKFLSHVRSVELENTQLKAQIGNVEREKLTLDQENVQLKVQMANNEGEKLYLQQCLGELEAKVRELEEKNKRLELKNKELEEGNEKLSSIEGDNQYLQQQVMELEVKNRELENEVKLNQLAISPSPQPGQPSANQLPVTGTFKPFGAEFIMTDFEEYQKDGDEWYSPHFYTHPNGYKVCLQVYANGDGSGKGTHLSLFVCLMRGEFDDLLKWPFRGRITVKLVNQEEDKDHVVETIDFTSSIVQKGCERVMVGQYGVGTGYGQFLPLTELQPKYLKNDCIKLCIKRVELF